MRPWTGIAPRPVECLWAGRLPIGYLALLLREALGALLAADRSWSVEVGHYRGLLALAQRDELAAELPRRSDAQRQALGEWDDALRDDPAALAPLPRFLLEPDDQAA